ncbi:hypothetical protein [Spirosoma spitsbergense]|uniref:hypothetical protein n=1 Tax=Spirosoma spitsbergense TaxID=431554 RepID=UPI000363E9E3|nr:hypothetical protein [Spirosoma spitsbergense]
MKDPTHSTGNPAAENGPQLRYSDDGRGGTIHYTSPASNFDMWYELAMSPAVVDIGIPESKYWVGQTKTPLAQRDDMLRFIGQQVVNDKLSGHGYFLFNDQIMTIYKGKNPDKD